MNYSGEIFRKLLRVLFEPKLNTSSYFFFQTLNYKFIFKTTRFAMHGS